MVKYCIHCGEILHDELIELYGTVVEICDYEERILELLEKEVKVREKDIIYYCFKCHTLFLIDFDKKQVRWLDWKNFRGRGVR